MAARQIEVLNMMNGDRKRTGPKPAGWRCRHVRMPAGVGWLNGLTYGYTMEYVTELVIMPGVAVPVATYWA
jgi:hypothetical protein